MDGNYISQHNLPRTNIKYDDGSNSYFGTGNDSDFWDDDDGFGSNEYATCRLDEFRFYSRKLETWEIKAIHDY